jgi:hypothetical protein
MKVLSLVTILCLAVGCASGEKPNGGAKAPAQNAYNEQTSAAPAATSGQPASGTVVQVTGKMGCGHCNFHIGETCSAAMQTADGKIYVIDGVAEDSEVFKNRMSGKEITVAGVVKEVDGISHIEAKSIM